MARTTAEAVKLLLAANYDSDAATNLTPFIDSASSIVDDVVECVSDLSLTALSSTKLELIERWIAAYLYTQSDPLYTSRSTASASGAFQEHSFLKGAIALDPSGCVKCCVEGAVTAGLNWLGLPVSDQTDYIDRD